MSLVIRDEANKKKKSAKNSEQFVSWKDKKILADNEEESLCKDVEELLKWTGLIESMVDKQLKEYVMNAPEELRAGKEVAKSTARRRAPRNGKSKCSSSSALMDAIWKHHREDGDDEEEK
ncbi:hypothetical protein Syun_003056 [Stephania yunnanensis]|uniref:Uncharacterized protein n=1 Tax=Stephania yunnanensis TaxID=152371 RepID=A0AAP0L2H7_9MAGN